MRSVMCEPSARAHSKTRNDADYQYVHTVVRAYRTTALSSSTKCKWPRSRSDANARRRQNKYTTFATNLSTNMVATKLPNSKLRSMSAEDAARSADAYAIPRQQTHKQESVASFTRAPSAQLVLLEHLLHASMAPRHILNHAHQVELAKARRAEHRRHLLRLLH